MAHEGYTVVSNTGVKSKLRRPDSGPHHQLPANVETPDGPGMTPKSAELSTPFTHHSAQRVHDGGTINFCLLNE